jgi:hypothetical protein
LLFGFVGALGAHEASADSPPSPPSRFAGTVLVDGKAPAAGTLIEAKIGTATCGVATVFMQGADARYTLDSPALAPDATPNCGTDGAVVAFYVGGKAATQVGSWRNYDINVLNLTVVTPPTVSPTPKSPSTGAGLVTGSGTEAAWLFAAFGLAALAFGVGGATVARRRS